MENLKQGRMDVKAAAAILGINVQSVRHLARKKRIGYLKVGRSYWFTEDDLKPVIEFNSPHAPDESIS